MEGVTVAPRLVLVAVVRVFAGVATCLPRDLGLAGAECAMFVVREVEVDCGIGTSVLVSIEVSILVWVAAWGQEDAVGWSPQVWASIIAGRCVATRMGRRPCCPMIPRRKTAARYMPKSKAGKSM